jgi:putative nucleotidyltransferase with HDIG domain
MSISAVRPPVRVRAYVAITVIVAVASFTIATIIDPLVFDASRSPLGVFTFVVVALLLELAEHRLAVGAAGSIAFILYLGAALVFGPTWGAIVTAAAVMGAQILNRRAPIKMAFNVAQYAIAILGASGIYTALGGPVPPVSLDAAIIPFAAMVFAFFTINSALVSTVIALVERRSVQEIWLRNTLGLAAYDLVASTLALGIAWLYLRSGVFGVAAIVAPILFIRHIYQVNLQLQATNREMLDVMVKSIEARDPYTSGHSQRVAELARRLARELGLGLREMDEIAAAALLHDVGKIYEEFAPILRKEGRLTAEERQVMETHAVRSAELVGTLSGLRGEVEQAVRHHHENYDGSGYPDGLSGDDIPLGARVIMVADTTDAMTSHRPYRAALSYEQVLEELGRYSGKQFDPVIVAALRQSGSVRSFVENARQPPGPASDLSLQLVQSS